MNSQLKRENELQLFRKSLSQNRAEVKLYLDNFCTVPGANPGKCNPLLFFQSSLCRGSTKPLTLNRPVWGLCASSCCCSSGLQTTALSWRIWPHVWALNDGTAKPRWVTQPTAARINYHTGLWPCHGDLHLHVAPSEPQILSLLRVNGLAGLCGVKW